MEGNMIATDTPNVKVDKPFLCSTLVNVIMTMNEMCKQRIVSSEAKKHLALAGFQVGLAIRAIASRG